MKPRFIEACTCALLTLAWVSCDSASVPQSPSPAKANPEAPPQPKNYKIIWRKSDGPTAEFYKSYEMHVLLLPTAERSFQSLFDITREILRPKDMYQGHIFYFATEEASQIHRSLPYAHGYKDGFLPTSIKDMGIRRRYYPNIIGTVYFLQISPESDIHFYPKGVRLNGIPEEDEHGYFPVWPRTGI